MASVGTIEKSVLKHCYDRNATYSDAAKLTMQPVGTGSGPGVEISGNVGAGGWAGASVIGPGVWPWAGGAVVVGVSVVAFGVCCPGSDIVVPPPHPATKNDNRTSEVVDQDFTLEPIFIAFRAQL